MKGKYRLISVLIALTLVVGCVHRWSTKLAYLNEEEWMDSDRRALLIDSPWVKSGEFPIGGWPGELAIIMQASASWLSPYFIHMRRVVAARLDKNLPKVLDFDPGQDKSIFSKGHLQLAEMPPYLLDRHLLLVSPMLKEGVGLWPSSVKASDAAHRQLYILPPRMEELELEMGDEIQAVGNIMIDLTLWPRFAALPRSAAAGTLDCLARIQGQLLLRGAELVMDDGKILPPRKVIILGHDVGGSWTRAVMEEGERTGLAAAPAMARLFFEQDGSGVTWPDSEQEGAVLHLSLPKDPPVDCAFEGEETLKLDIKLSFDLWEMRVAGAWGI